MPKAPTRPKSATPTNDDTDGKAEPNAGTPKGLAGYRTVAGGRPPKEDVPDEERAQRERREKFSWGDLGAAGIAGLRIVDVWEDVDKTYGAYVGATVRIPKVGTNPSKDVLVLTGGETRAGKTLTHALNAGTLADADGSDDTRGVPVSIRLKKSPNYPDGQPMVYLTFGAGAQ